MPALYAWERGTSSFPASLSSSLRTDGLLRSTWLRWICFGFTVNLKPYLVLGLRGGLRRKWRWTEGCAVACRIIYVASFFRLERYTARTHF